MSRQEPTRWKHLAQSLRAGDMASEDKLSRLFYPQVMAMAADRLRDRENAREVTQEILLAVILALREGKLRQPEKLPAFVVGTARNLINNYIRKRIQHPNQVQLEEERVLVSGEGAATRQPPLEEEERKKLVLKAIQRLKPLDRGILFLTLVEDLNPREIAIQLNLKPENVRLRKSRAMRIIHRRMERLIQKSGPDHK